MDTGGYKGLQEVTGGYKVRRLKEITRAYSGLQGVTGRYKGLQEVTGGYMWIQEDTRD